jgi:lipid II:glycine glycyltransferase (peptidoglycan interpeptide bridge formation enzyme)
MNGLEFRRNSLIHSKKYYDKIYDVIIGNNIGVFAKATFEGKIISGLIIVVLGDKAWALFMANDYEYRKLAPNKFLLWEAIKYANNQRCRFLDLGSTQGTERFDPENDPLDFLKKAYCPEVKNYPGYFDMKGFLYHGFRFTETYAIPIIFKLYYILNRMLKIK